MMTWEESSHLTPVTELFLSQFGEYAGTTVAILTGKSDLFPLGKKKLLAAKGRPSISSGPKGPPKYLGGLWPLKVAFS